MQEKRFVIVCIRLDGMCQAEVVEAWNEKDAWTRFQRAFPSRRGAALCVPLTEDNVTFLN